MPHGLIHPVWQGEDCYVIGGGPSLSSFDWSLIKDERTIGCNAAYSLGADISKVVVFGDLRFFGSHKEGLAEYALSGSPVYTNCAPLRGRGDVPWLWTLKRLSRGLSAKEDTLAWNHSTGAMAVNLALLLGCRRIFLLGFDMAHQEDKTHWHDLYNLKGGKPKPQRPSVYVRFINGMQQMAAAMSGLFPGCEVITVSDETRLDTFPIVGLEEHFSGKLMREEVRL